MPTFRERIRSARDAFFQERETVLGITSGRSPGQAATKTSSAILRACTLIRCEMMRDVSYEVVGAPLLERFLRSISMPTFQYNTEYGLFLDGATYAIAQGEGEAMTLVTKAVRDVQEHIVRGQVQSYQVNGIGMVPPERVLEFKTYDGIGAKELLSKYVILETKSIEARAAYLEDGIKPKGYATPDNDYKGAPVTLNSPEEWRAMDDSLELLQKYWDPTAKDRIPALKPGWKIERFDSPSDPMFDQSLHAARVGIATGARIPMPLLSLTDSIKYNNLAEAERQLLDTSIRSDALLIADVINSKLAPLLSAPVGEVPPFRFIFEDAMPLAAWRVQDAQASNLYTTAAQRLVAADIWTEDEARVFLQAVLTNSESE